MKKNLSYLIVSACLLLAISSCGTNYQTTKSGMKYKIFADGKKSDSVGKVGSILKLTFTQKINDSILESNAGEMPVYFPLQANEESNYNPTEILQYLRKGDSAVAIMEVDSMIKKNLIPSPLPEPFKAGDKLSLGFRVLEIFADTALANADRKKETVKFEPVMKKKMEAQKKKMLASMQEQKKLAEQEAEKSGDAAKQIALITAFLDKKGIKAEKISNGTFVYKTKQGTGDMAKPGQFVTVKYNGKLMATEKSFEQNQFTFPLGEGQVITGWDEGLQQFRKGDVGTIYIPGFKAYGKNPQPGSPFGPDENLMFDVEVIDISNTQPPPPPNPSGPNGGQ